MNILVSVSGYGVTAAQVDGGNVNGRPFVNDNKPGVSLKDFIRKY